MKKRILGIIGGSVLYQIEGLENIKWKKVNTAWGEPSDRILSATLNKKEIYFIPRHKRGHRISPSNINFRANIEALKKMGVTDIVSVSAVGSLQEHLKPGSFVVVDQFIDRTFARIKTFFDKEIVAHVSMAKPTSPALMKCCESALVKCQIPHQVGGTYLVMEGPQFSSLAESKMYRTWTADVIGMTNMPEAKLAREAEMCYATVAMVTDFDCWHPDHDNVTVETIIKVLTENADKARTLVREIVPRLSSRTETYHAGCQTALDTALITAPNARDPVLMETLSAVAGRVLQN